MVHIERPHRSVGALVERAAMVISLLQDRPASASQPLEVEPVGRLADALEEPFAGRQIGRRVELHRLGGDDTDGPTALRVSALTPGAEADALWARASDRPVVVGVMTADCGMRLPARGYPRRAGRRSRGRRRRRSGRRRRATRRDRPAVRCPPRSLREW
ncbi:hypothetical protein [Nannocystis pusilla]|uniref:Uncharacterized protein n=1 Tax=Nannocystis pusilla TaxID=889268 RepID=A0ABS7TXN7_9BACT|nr:hypothetical protein [Nannocystis pusilla]MBZ5712916.1 hypothetical protein [Nannocystis pusilla]